MKTPENFNHNPNIGLTPMAKSSGGEYNKSLLTHDKSNEPVNEAKNKPGEMDKSVLSFKDAEVGGCSMAK